MRAERRGSAGRQDIRSWNTGVPLQQSGGFLQRNSRGSGSQRQTVRTYHERRCYAARIFRREQTSGPWHRRQARGNRVRRITSDQEYPRSGQERRVR